MLSFLVTLLGTCTYSNYNNSYTRDYEYKDNVISRITITYIHRVEMHICGDRKNGW